MDSMVWFGVNQLINMDKFIVWISKKKKMFQVSIYDHSFSVHKSLVQDGFLQRL